MITLTTPPDINSVLGGTAPVAFDKLVLHPVTFYPQTGTIQGQIQLSATANTDMVALSGTFTIANGAVEIQVPQLDFYRRVVLTGPQQTTVATIINDAQDALESGLVSIGVVSGTQAPGQ